MKKLFFIVLFGIMALFMTKVYAEESIPLYEEVNNVLTKFENPLEWQVPYFAPYYINGKMFIDVNYEYCTKYNEEKECENTVRDFFLASTENLDNKVERPISDYSVIDNYYYTLGYGDKDDDNKYSYTMTKYDENFKQVGQITFKTESYYEVNYSTLIKNVNNELVFIELNDLYRKEGALYREQNGEKVEEYEKKIICNYVAFDDDLTTATEKSCDDTIVPESIKNYIIQNDRVISDNTYDIDENRSVVVYINELYYYENDELVFKKNTETENAHFFKVRFLDKYIVVAEDHVNGGEVCNSMGRESFGKDCVNYSKLLFYDKDGNLVKTIDDNSNIYDFNVDREYNKLVMTNVDYDGVCALFAYGWIETCVPTLRYSMYVYGQEPEKTPDKPNEVIGEEPNPNTSDFVIIIITILCVSIVLLTNVRHHKKELED